MHYRKAFTLIELLVVIAIIALLLAIIMPSLNTVKELASSVVCVSNEKQILIAWHMYATENESRICGSNTAEDQGNWVEATSSPTTVEQEINGTAPSAASGNQGIKGGVLYKYYEDPKVLHCPIDRRYRNPPTDTTFTGDGGYRTYSFIGSMNGGDTGNCLKTSDIANPSSKYILVEENDNRGFNWNSWIMDPGTPPGMIDAFAVFHNMRSALGFADGHAEKIVWKDERTETYSKEIAEGRRLLPPYTTAAEELDNEDFMWLQNHYAKKR
jgi:prepilin-type N-terminal cleavage/methylation domain-containing protein